MLLWYPRVRPARVKKSESTVNVPCARKLVSHTVDDDQLDFLDTCFPEESISARNRREHVVLGATEKDIPVLFDYIQAIGRVFRPRIRVSYRPSTRLALTYPFSEQDLKRAR